MSQLDKKTMQALRADIDAALEVVRSKYGLKDLHAGNASFSPNGHFHFKLEGMTAGGMSADEEAYNEVRSYFDLPELGTVFTHKGVSYRISGYRSKASKYPVLCENVKTGAMSGFGIDFLKFLVARRGE